MPADLPEHSRRLPVCIGEGQNRASGAQVLIELVRHLVGLLLSQQQEYVGVVDERFCRCAGNPVLDVHDIGQPEHADFLFHRNWADRPACADEVHAHLLGSYSALSAYGGEAPQEWPRVPAMVERPGVRNPNRSGAPP